MSGQTSSPALPMLLMAALVALVAHASLASSLPTVKASSSLYAVWANWNAQFNISTIDPSTGVAGPSVYVGQLMQEWAITPAVDHRAKRIFVPINGGPTFGGMLAVIDASDPNKMVLTKQIAFPGEYFWGVQYDSVTDRVWVVSGSLHAAPGTAPSPPFLVRIDLVQGTARNVTNLPPGHIPSAQGIGGGPLVLDEKNRVLVIPTTKDPNRPTESFALTKFDIDKEHYLDSIPLPQLYPSALAKDHRSGAVYGLFSSVPRDGLTFGLLNTVDGSIKALNRWNSTEFVFIIGSLAAVDSSSGHFYSVIGNGGGPPVALVTVSTATGAIQSAHFFKGQQAQGLFVL